MTINLQISPYELRFVDELDEENYSMWRTWISFTLRREKLWSIVDGSEIKLVVPMGVNIAPSPTTKLGMIETCLPLWHWLTMWRIHVFITLLELKHPKRPRMNRKQFVKWATSKIRSIWEGSLNWRWTMIRAWVNIYICSGQSLMNRLPLV